MAKNDLTKLGTEMSVSGLESLLDDIKIPTIEVIMMGVITANTLNVRALPSKTGDIVGKLKKNDVVSIFSLKDKWCRIKYNGDFAHISTDFVRQLQGKVTAGTLNVRDKDGKDGAVVGQLKRDEVVDIIQQLPKWYKIKFKNQSAFASSDYIKALIDDQEDIPVVPTETFLKDDKSLLSIELEPSKKFQVPASPRESKIVAETYNKFGGLLTNLSKSLKIETAASVAVLSVESGGKGFGADGKVIIRFENHLFHRFWGTQNQKTFDDHFQFSSSAGWKGHMFRKNKSDEWSTFHGNQQKEWEVLEFARTLNSSAAIMSASFGLPQVIGSNFKRIGYNSPEEMLEYFEKNISYHIIALFDFFTPEMKTYLRKKDFTSFAADYNGRGQATRYGGIIQTYYNAFNKLK